MMQLPYESHAPIWEARATIRSRPRRLIEDDQLQYYPTDRQPLCAHPDIASLGADTRELILLHSLYKYINDIIIFETEIVNQTARRIAKGNFPFDFPFSCRHDALSVVIDEEYHSYVAMDYLQQVQQRTGIAPIALPQQIELSRAIPLTLATLAPQQRAGMELIAVAISENTVTAEVAAFARDTSLKRSVKGLMADHLADEGRHAVFWIKLVQLYWASLDEASRVAIGGALPFFLEHYLTSQLEADFNCRLLASLEMADSVRQRVAADMGVRYPITRQHPMMVNIMQFFKLSGMLQHAPTRHHLDAFI